MEFQGDPFRTLGVSPDASLNEVRSAYRRLAKQYHPDTAGERALSRFLAIQAAYERLVDDQGRLRSAGGDPWRPGPPPRRASRDAWRARRTGPRPAGASGSSGTGSRAGSGTRSGSAAGGRDASDAGTGARPEGERTRRRGPRKATPGSTSYDEAAETPFEPEWDGGAWYGPSMGTFWTINPREYADPRKHGPEYLARARRAGGSEPAGASAGPATADPGELGTAADADEAADGGWAWSGRGQTTTGGDTADWAARAWTYNTGDPGTTWTPGGERRRRRDGIPPDDATSAPELPDIETLLRLGAPSRLLRHARRDRTWRLAIAVLGALPIAVLLGTLLSEATGCASFAAGCPDAVPALQLALVPILILGLYAVPRLSAVAAFATLALFAVAIPVGLVLSVGTGPRSEETRVILRVAVATAYAAAFVGAAWWLWRRPPEPDPGP